MSSAAKELRGDERARQSARQTAERARKKQPQQKAAAATRSKRGGVGHVNLDDDNGGEDEGAASSGTETEQEQDAEDARPAQEVPLAELVAQRISRKDTQESFEIVRAAGDRGVVALEDSVELPGPGEGWERVESRDAEDRPSYSDVAGVKKA
ncbi:hypothetical protein AURDEDRAFT_113624 [Auricularia subglabra TFB-10046 SS5]|nr:hypothetical protein AURDEDRAFT_113624 [Auricularia subglabra TFB-10046 SS5]